MPTADCSGQATAAVLRSCQLLQKHAALQAADVDGSKFLCSKAQIIDELESTLPNWVRQPKWCSPQLCHLCIGFTCQQMRRCAPAKPAAPCHSCRSKEPDPEHLQLSYPHHSTRKCTPECVLCSRSPHSRLTVGRRCPPYIHILKVNADTMGSVESDETWTPYGAMEEKQDKEKDPNAVRSSAVPVISDVVLSHRCRNQTACEQGEVPQVVLAISMCTCGWVRVRSDRKPDSLFCTSWNGVPNAKHGVSTDRAAAFLGRRWLAYVGHL